jgi:serine/threonine-protein kinase RsbW
MGTTTTLRRNGPDEPDRLDLPVHPSAIASARREVARRAMEAGIGIDRIDDLVVAVSEACTNALEAQQRAGVTSPIELAVVVTDDVLEVRVQDAGRGFAPDAIPPRPPRADPHHLDVERGWGIQLMRELVDELVFDFTSGTAVCLRMRLRPNR